MKIFKTTILLALLLMVASAGNAQRKKVASPFFFIQLTDPQFGFIDPGKGFEKETELYEKAVRAINRLKPDFVVITGDFVNSTKDRSQITEFKRITATIDPKIPVYFVPGNHDIGNVADSLNVGIYLKDYGYDRFSFRHKNCQFIGFNSCLIKSNTPNLEKSQYDWLKETTAKSKKAAHTILFCHHPFFIKSFDEPETYSNIGAEGRKKYLDLFSANEVEAIFSGHLHNNASARFGTIEVVTTSALGKPLGNAPSGLRIVKVFNDRIEHQYYGLDEIPEKVTFN
jgi:3',5'-cyclic AMP phosphodiesterase CpdA